MVQQCFQPVNIILHVNPCHDLVILVNRRSELGNRNRSQSKIRSHNHVIVRKITIINNNSTIKAYGLQALSITTFLLDYYNVVSYSADLYKSYTRRK